MAVKVYDALAMPYGHWGPWVLLDGVWNGEDKPFRMSIKSWQLDKIKAPYDGQIYWFGDDDKNAHLTTFNDSIDVDLAGKSIQQPKVRFTNHGVTPALIRFTVGALLVLPSWHDAPLRDETFASNKEVSAAEAWMVARSRSIRTQS